MSRPSNSLTVATSFIVVRSLLDSRYEQELLETARDIRTTELRERADSVHRQVAVAFRAAGSRPAGSSWMHLPHDQSSFG
jgi:hypothetical protein